MNELKKKRAEARGAHKSLQSLFDVLTAASQHLSMTGACDESVGVEGDEAYCVNTCTYCDMARAVDNVSQKDVDRWMVERPTKARADERAAR